MKRTTIELDEDLVERAKRALGLTTTKSTVTEALRRVADAAEGARAEQASRQLADLGGLGEHLDLTVLGSEVAWR